ncbi:MAG: hypothetical protein KU28_00830 [Sulfurovum sp. PC08-66]|nr:MAG: hypothetical protein KU28_00830 [Sulfurovum sp. PC08-66]KIM12511.1 MAG: hypothetical protein KU37_00945 [Sulfuricurvum sp. PC08-66]
MQAHWLSLAEFAKTVDIDFDTIEEMIGSGKLITKEEDGDVYVDATSHTHAIIPQVMQNVSTVSGQMSIQQAFVEKTIGTIISLHEKVLATKDEMIATVKDENAFLKEAIYQMQELYNEDRKTVDTLTAQLKHSQDEVAYLHRKYKLMWGKVVEDYATEKRPA